ncbi:aminopeptidase [Arabiibacter massiliensis]|uniref:aminopeptidase n=1 Tax=Arabiibacter massiliensis TaxID=1870985 RepID=UPI001E4615ED|nr:aminopeptidase [Arabiibacter massiliensis]
MPEILDHVAYLSQEIGPRPAGTEEEQQAALYITEQMQKDAGLSAVIEDFSGAPGSEMPKVICCALTLVFTLVSLFLPVVGVAAIVVALIAGALFAAEALDRPVLSKAFARGVSQNVVAKYEPGYSAEAGGTRRRKVIVVARYDSGKVRSELAQPLLPVLPILNWGTLGAMVLLPFLLILRNVVFLNAEGAVAVVLNALTVIALVFAALPLVVALLHKLAAYNEGANCNAAGTAVLLEMARRVGRGRVSEAELAERSEAAVHGEEAARAAGLVPEGAQLVYEAANVKPPEPAPQSPEARLAAAKAAIAALSGKPVSGTYASDIAQNLVQVKEQPLPEPTEEDLRELHDETREALSTLPPETMQAALANAEAAAAGLAKEAAESAVSVAAGVMEAYRPATQPDEGADGVPDWFKKAQEKAKKPRNADKPVQRSRYASALDAAVTESAGHFAEANRIVEEDLERSLDTGREEIREVKAPQWAPPAEEAADDSAPQSDAAAPEPEAPADPSSTTAMPPLDVSSLGLDDVPPMGEPSLPAFLDPRKVQEEAQSAFADARRTDRRVDVTGVPIGDSGRIDYPLDGSVPSGAVPTEAAEAARRRPIVLPDIGLSGKLAPITELPKQRAPLAEVETSGKTAAKSLLTMLPAIDLGGAAGAEASAAGAEGEASAAPSDGGRKAALQSMLPSLSGSLPRSDAPADARPSNVSAAGSFAPAGATGTFAPVGDELLQNIDPSDIYVDDADDSAYDENFTETGAFAGPGYVEMPKSRVHRLFDRFRRKKDEEEPTPQEWLDVDETFDARSVGAERGGWESFRDEEGESLDPGATTRMDFAAADGYDDEDYYYDDAPVDHDATGRRPWNGGAFSPRRMERADMDSAALAEESEAATGDWAEPGVPEELKHVYQFRNPDINTEVWFVALGSELSQNGGMRAFLTEHQQDLRGSIIVDLDALGAGELCMIEREGEYRSVKTSSRMKRYVKKASQATGLDVGAAQLPWMNSAASCAIRHGYQAMHLVGMDGGKPAFFAQANDVLENIDEETLTANADFVMELLKNI